MDYVALKAEIVNDPLQLGYAGHVENDTPTFIADLLNDPAGPGSGTLPRTTVATSDPAVKSMLAYALTRIHGMTDANKQNFYLTLVTTIGLVGSLDPQDVNTQATIALAVADGVVTTDLVGAVAQRRGSRAEVLLGEGASVSWEDVKTAILS